MKKTLILGCVAIISACAHENNTSALNDYNYSNDQYVGQVQFVQDNVIQSDMAYSESIPHAVVVESVCPCQETVPVVMDPCKCAHDTTPREVLRPRIKETLPVQTARNCPKDSQIINCGCGQCQVFEKDTDTEDKVKEVVPEMPQAYELAASRAFNHFIKDTFDIYSKKPDVLLHVEQAQLDDNDLPGGVENGVMLFKNKVLTSRTFVLEEDKAKAEYVLQTSAQWFDTPSKEVPAIKYTIKLLDNKNKIVNQWVEIVKKAENSQKWL